MSGEHGAENKSRRLSGRHRSVASGGWDEEKAGYPTVFPLCFLCALFVPIYCFILLNAGDWLSSMLSTCIRVFLSSFSYSIILISFVQSIFREFKRRQLC